MFVYMLISDMRLTASVCDRKTICAYKQYAPNNAWVWYCSNYTTVRSYVRYNNDLPLVIVRDAIGTPSISVEHLEGVLSRSEKVSGPSIAIDVHHVVHVSELLTLTLDNIGHPTLSGLVEMYFYVCWLELATAGCMCIQYYVIEKGLTSWL